MDVVGLGLEYAKQSHHKTKEIKELNLVIEAARILIRSETDEDDSKKSPEDLGIEFLRRVGPIIQNTWKKGTAKFEDDQKALKTWKTAFGDFAQNDWNTLCFFPSMLPPKRKAYLEEVFNTKEEGLVVRYLVLSVPEDKNAYTLRVCRPLDKLIRFSAEDTVSRLLAISDPKVCFERNMFTCGSCIGDGDISVCNTPKTTETSESDGEDSEEEGIDLD